MDNFEERKQQLKQRIKEQEEKLERKKQYFILAVKNFAVKWIMDYAEKEVTTRKPEVTKSLGKKLKYFKQKVSTLVEKVPILSKVEFSQKKYWRHLEDFTEKSLSYQYRFSGNRQPEILDRGVRSIIGQLGDILEEYNYLDPRKRLEQWKRAYNNSVEKPYYPFWLKWSEEMRSISQNYAKELEELERLHNDLQNVIKKEEQSEAKKAWESY